MVTAATDTYSANLQKSRDTQLSKQANTKKYNPNATTTNTAMSLAFIIEVGVCVVFLVIIFFHKLVILTSRQD